MLTSSYAQVKQAGNGVIKAFDFSFKILANTDLAVYTIDASGTQSALLALNTDYTVTFDPIAETGTVTYTTAPVSGGFSLVGRVSDNTQESNLQREGPMPAKTVETMIDKSMMLIQELQANAVAPPAGLSSGLWAARPSAPSGMMYYYSTDRASLELWIPAAAKWFLIG